MDRVASGGTGQVLGIGQPGPQVGEGGWRWGWTTAYTLAPSFLSLLPNLAESIQHRWRLRPGLLLLRLRLWRWLWHGQWHQR